MKIQYILFIIFIYLLSGCQTPPPDKWEMGLPIIGSNSSPKASDLNGDGVQDIVLGAGRNEFQDATERP